MMLKKELIGLEECAFNEFTICRPHNGKIVRDSKMIISSNEATTKNRLKWHHFLARRFSLVTFFGKIELSSIALSSIKSSIDSQADNEIIVLGIHNLYPLY